MDQCTHEVRLQYWKDVIAKCQARPSEQTAKQWMKENGICEQSYYAWQRRIRKEVYGQMVEEKILPAVMDAKEVAFTELPYTNKGTSMNKEPDQPIHPVAVIKTNQFSIALANDIPDTLLVRILQEVSHA